MPLGGFELRDVNFSYPHRPLAPVLRGVSLTVKPGQVAALVGPSGSGKSSVVALLLRLYDATGGVVLVDGVDVQQLPPRALRDCMGWVTQEPPLFNESIEYNIAYGRAGGAARKPAPGGGGSTPPPDVARAAADAQAADFISSFERRYATPVGVGGSALSGGQKQRVALARALIRAPRILLLDEATAALDSASEREVQASIDAALGGGEGGREGRATALIVAHRLSTIARADIIFVLEEGRLVEQGGFSELLAKGGAFARLAAAQGVGAA